MRTHSPTALEPVVTYEGDVAGLPTTKPGRGEKIDPRSEVSRYAGHTRERHDALFQKAGGTKRYEYVYAYNGFAAELTTAQAAHLRVAGPCQGGALLGEAGAVPDQHPVGLAQVLHQVGADVVAHVRGVRTPADERR